MKEALIDTHCHIHESDYPDSEGAYTRALEAGVGAMVCVGTNEASSRMALQFAAGHEHAYASIGVHPHDTKDGYLAIKDLFESEKLVAVGEIGLDYFYTHSPREVQIAALEAQLQMALDHNVPVIFHVRDAFHDFWPIFDHFRGLRGILHSYTDNMSNLERGLAEGLYVGVNGISTFSKVPEQLEMFDTIPLERMVLETDAPFLTPVPHRGRVNEPAFVKSVAEFHANRRKVELERLARVTSANARAIFAL